MTNLTPFESNVCAAFRGHAMDYSASEDHCEESDAIFLRFAQKDKLKAEKCALEWLQIAPFVEWLISAHERGTDEIKLTLMAFFKERQVRRYFPNN